MIRKAHKNEKNTMLDSAWIERVMRDVECSASTVITVETADPTRREQLLDYARQGDYESILRFDPWNGLTRYEANTGQFEAVRAPANSGYDAGLQNDFRDLDGALRYMDTMLRQKRVFFLIAGLDRTAASAERTTVLIDALRSWIHSPDIQMTKSVTCLLAARPAITIDQTTLEMTALVRPDAASFDDRLAITKSIVEKSVSTTDEDLHALAIATAGLDLHQIRVVLLKTLHANGGFPIDIVKHYKADYIRRNDVVEIEEPSIGFDDVGGNDGAKEIVRNTLINAMRHPQRAKLAALDLPRGLLLFGPPGTGKTLFAKALAKETNLPFINMRTENLFRPLLGESGERVRNAIRIAETASPALVFIDEIDRFGRRTSGGSDGASQETGRVFAQMLEWLGDPKRKSIIVGTTNVPEHLDPAFLRPGRFSYVVPLLYPNAVARMQILQMHLGLAGSRPRPHMDAESVQAVLGEIVKRTRLYSGADIEELVTRAKQAFFQSTDKKMTREHLVQAFRDFKVGMEEREMIVRRYYELGPMFSNSMKLLREYEDGDAKDGAS